MEGALLRTKDLRSLVRSKLVKPKVQEGTWSVTPILNLIRLTGPVLLNEWILGLPTPGRVDLKSLPLTRYRYTQEGHQGTSTTIRFFLPTNRPSGCLQGTQSRGQVSVGRLRSTESLRPRRPLERRRSRWCRSELPESVYWVGNWMGVDTLVEVGGGTGRVGTRSDRVPG